MQVYIVNQNASVVDIEIYAERLCLERWFVEESTNVNVLIKK